MLQVVLSDDPPFELCLSLALVLEYHDVLNRPAILGKTDMAEDEVDILLAALTEVSTEIDILLPVRPCSPDPGDDFVVELVVNARAERLVTYNVRDFAGPSSIWSFVVCTPGALLREIREI